MGEAVAHGVNAPRRPDGFTSAAMFLVVWCRLPMESPLGGAACKLLSYSFLVVVELWGLTKSGVNEVETGPDTLRCTHGAAENGRVAGAP